MKQERNATLEVTAAGTEIAKAAVKTSVEAQDKVADNEVNHPALQEAKPEADLQQSLAPASQAKGKAHGHTGPKSQKGKNSSRWNALIDGATAKSSVLPFEDERAYRRHIKAVEQALCPVNYIEQQMVREYAEGLWRIIRHEKRGSYEREEILSCLTPAMAAQFLNLKEGYVRCAPQWLIDPQHKISLQEQKKAQDALGQYRHLITNAKGIANFNLVWRQYPLLFELVAEWLADQYPGSTPLLMSTGKDLHLAWQQHPEKLLPVLEEFANQVYFVAHFESFKPRVRVWMESWYFLQRTAMHRLERAEQLLLKERNYAYSILERLIRFRKSNTFLQSAPASVQASFAKNEMT